MKNSHYTNKNRWDEAVAKLSETYQVYAPVEIWDRLDYKLIHPGDTSEIVYNKSRPATPLKSFLLPVKQNVTKPTAVQRKIVIGVPNCDLKALQLLDSMYLENDYEDPAYKSNRENTVIIGCDCYQPAEHCHCTSYDVDPYPNGEADITLSLIGEEVILQVNTEKGQEITDSIRDLLHLMETRKDLEQQREKNRKKARELLDGINNSLPDYQTSTSLISSAPNEVWEAYSQNCVACGACATSCPTCTCFLLIDRPGFEKVRSQDACQYPGFERVAAGENPLGKRSKRFKNRYMCKYVWRPERFKALACTGCGRCIEACIGNINKNELLLELSSEVKTV